jgi:hypothetical protein
MNGGAPCIGRNSRLRRCRLRSGCRAFHPGNPQAFNRYSYVGNDPLTFTDPSGFSWLSSFFNDVSTFFRAVFANPLVRAVARIAIAAVLSLQASVYAQSLLQHLAALACWQ